jgi:hypothetical protein
VIRCTRARGVMWDSGCIRANELLFSSLLSYNTLVKKVV